MQDGGALGIRDGFIPRLVTYTAEDRAAKGLRSFRDQKGESHPPLHFAALELVQDERFVLLMAGRGEGKTSLALHLALHLAGDIVGDAEFGIAGLIRSIPRNEEGDERPVTWSLGRTLPVILSAAEGDTWDTMLSRGAPGLRTLLNEPGWPGSTGVLFIVDGLEHLGAAGPGLLREIADFATGHAGIRVVGLGAPDPVNTWPLPEGASKYTLLPLLHAQRQHFAHDVLAPRGLGLSPAALSPLAAHPGLFSLALNISGSAASREELLDLWLTATTNDPDAVARSGFDSLSDVLSDDGTSGYRGFLLDLLAARHLASQPLALAADLYRRSPRVWASALPSLAARAAGSPARLAELVAQLTLESTDDCLMGALLIADAVPPELTLAHGAAGGAAADNRRGTPVAGTPRPGRPCPRRMGRSTRPRGHGCGPRRHVYHGLVHPPQFDAAARRRGGGFPDRAVPRHQRPLSRLRGGDRPSLGLDRRVTDPTAPMRPPWTSHGTTPRPSAPG